MAAVHNLSALRAQVDTSNLPGKIPLSDLLDYSLSLLITTQLLIYFKDRKTMSAVKTTAALHEFNRKAKKKNFIKLERYLR